MTQATLGAGLGMTQSAYSRLERGETITMPQIKKLATILGVEPGDLLKTTDVAAARLSEQGVTVLDDRPKNSNNDWLWVAGAVVAAVVVLSMVSHKSE